MPLIRDETVLLVTTTTQSLATTTTSGVKKSPKSPGLRIQIPNARGGNEINALKAAVAVLARSSPLRATAAAAAPGFLTPIAAIVEEFTRMRSGSPLVGVSNSKGLGDVSYSDIADDFVAAYGTFA
ncbi:hypothetical protein BDR26DRAFT_900595 [Obelidium mucronatum]|nr:hypothetical protein BDR26DRAFT_900595 [Obelidium mucronatum]